MRDVFVHQDSARVGLYKSMLDANGIPNFIRNGLSNNSVTDLPSGVFFPALCVVDDADYERAIEILRHVHKPEPSEVPDWKCAGCGEEVPGTFEHCWKCGQSCAEAATSPVGAGDIRTGRLSGESAMPAAAGSAQRIANIFRLLVLANVLLGLVSLLLLPRLELHPAPEVSQWLEEQNETPLWLRNFASLVWSVRPVLWGISQLLCFLLWNPGRLCLITVMACDAFLVSVCSSGLYLPAAGLLLYLQDLISGALLALMYLSPLRERFSFESQAK